MKILIKTRRYIRLFLAAMSLLMTIGSCDLADDLLGGNEVISNIEGVWMCDEDYARRKAILEIYEVEIMANPNNDDGIIIYNIFGLGDGIFTEAEVNVMTISLDDDVTGGFHITGTGIISSDFEEINWTYSVDDGSGVPENFTAVYTRVK